MGTISNRKPELLAQYDATSGKPTALAFAETFFRTGNVVDYNNARHQFTDVTAALTTNALETSGDLQFSSGGSLTPTNVIAFVSSDNLLFGVGIISASNLVSSIAWFGNARPTTGQTFSVRAVNTDIIQEGYKWTDYVMLTNATPTLQSGTFTGVVNGVTYTGQAYSYPVNLNVSGTLYRLVPSPYNYIGDCLFTTLTGTVLSNPVANRASTL